MFGKAKKTVSLAYKDKLLAEIAYYEKRISDALLKSNSHSLNSFEEVESSDDDSNPYYLNNDPSSRELRTLEASLSSRASMTLELAMLTIMQSEVNIMVIAPHVRNPVKEDGTWLEVAAECKIDLVSFTVTFFAHKPHRRFAPVSYRNVEVALTKAAHERELAQSVLSKLNRPNLALQVLQSYATAFRSRRTTLLELAEKYADKVRMEAVPEGGYRVKFLDLLTVDWSLENLWSPIAPFCHRMKFEVEYMPKDYIHAIGRLYKRFKDPSLETAERTHVLAEIFDTCLLAQGPARDLQESAESDPDTAGRLHERRTTIDQEPEIPLNYVQMSPKKQPKGKENKAQNRKTAMEPPKTIPKKAKKTAKNSRPNIEPTNDTDSNGSMKSKAIDKDVTSDNQMEKKTRPNSKDVTGDIQMETSNSKPIEENDFEGRRGIKRGTENHTQTNAKKMRSDNDISDVSKSTGDKANGKRNNGDVISDTKDVTNAFSTNNAPKKDNKASSAKNVNSKDDSEKRGGIKSTNATSLKKKGVDDNVVSEISVKENANTVDNSKDKGDPKKNRNNPDKEGILHSNTANVNAGNSKKNSHKKDKFEPNTGVCSVNPKNSTQTGEEVKSPESANNKNIIKEGKSQNLTKRTMDANKEIKCVQDKDSNNVTNVTQKVKKNANKNAHVTRKSNIVDKTAVDKVKKVQAEFVEEVKNDVKKAGIAKIASSKNTNDPNGNLKKIDKKSNKVENKTSNNKPSDAVKETNNKALKMKKTIENADKKKVDAISSKSNNQLSKENVKTTEKNQAINVTFTKTNDIKTGENDKTAKLVTTKDNAARKIDTNKETLVQKNKNTKTLSDANTEKYDERTRKVAVANVEKPNTGAKAVNSKENDIKTDAKAQTPTPKEAVEKDKISAKSTAAKMPTRILSNVKNNKAETINTNTILSNKQNNATAKRAVQKFAENQTKITEKLKSQIPTMRSKIKISALNNKMDKNAAKNDAKTKIPQKILPVFKKTVKNFPIRISPRKLPSSFKPSSQGFSRK